MKKEFILNGINEEFEVLSAKDGKLSISCGGQNYLFELVHRGKNEMVIRVGDTLHRVFYGASSKQYFISVDGRDAIFENTAQRRSKKTSDLLSGYASPMPGKILKIFVSKGEKVNKGQVLLVMEAMKMEHSIIANNDGIIKNVCFKDGDYVEGDVQLLEME